MRAGDWILIVDDDFDTLDLLGDLLALEGLIAGRDALPEWDSPSTVHSAA